MLLTSSAILFTLGLSAAACSTGSFLLDFVFGEAPPARMSLRLALSFGLGLGALSILAFLIGLAGFFTAPALIVLTVCFFLCGMVRLPWVACAMIAAVRAPWKVALNRMRDPGGRLVGGWLFFCLLLAAADLFAVMAGSLAPPTGNDFDGLAYHLTVPKLYLQWGAIRYDAFQYDANWPQFMEMLYGIGIACRSPSPRLIHLVIGLAVTAVCFLAARRWGRTAALVAALCFWFVPVIGWDAGSAYDDLAFALFEGLAFLSWNEWWISQDPKAQSAWVRVAGVMQGLGMGVKYSAVAFYAPFLLLFLARTPCVIRPGLRPYLDIPELRRGVQAVIRFVLLSLAVASPWYLRTFFWTHNPVFPFYYSVFGGRNWTAAAEAFYRKLQLEYGMGRGLRDLVFSPWRLVSRPAPFYEPHGSPIFGAVYGALGPLPWMLVVLNFIPRPPSKHAWANALAFVGFFLEWFFLMQAVRYLIPALPMLAPAWARAWSALDTSAKGDPNRIQRAENATSNDATSNDAAGNDAAGNDAAGVEQVSSASLRSWRPLSLPAGIVALVISAVFLYVTAIYGFINLVSPLGADPILYDLGSTSREDYLQQALPDLSPVLDWVNSSVPESASLGLIGEKRAYYFRPSTFWLDGYEQEMLRYQNYSSSSQLTSALRQNRFTYVLVRLGGRIGLAGVYGSPSTLPGPWDWNSINYHPGPGAWPPDRHWLELYRDAVRSGELVQVYPDAASGPTDAAGFAVYRVSGG